ncbi:MAG: demethoxyubiquinone hydroxylase family protein, partial [Alphaproteobacteria bacterium]
MPDRRLSTLDRLIVQLDQALHTVLGPTPEAGRPSPEANQNDANLTAADRELAGRLMRINHAGEICAQALYQGQAVTAKLPEVRGKMEQAAQEE